MRFLDVYTRIGGSSGVYVLKDYYSKDPSRKYNVEELSDIIDENVSPEITEALTANKDDDYIISYYVYENEEYAKKTFNNKKTTYDNISIKKTYLESNGTNYNKYRLVSGGRIIYISRVDNTLIIALTKEDNKKEVDEIIKKLGY